MTGEIIYFQSHLALKRGELYRQQAVPRRAPVARRSMDATRSLQAADYVADDRNAQTLELQVARVAHLLEELEALAGSSENCPPATLAQARTSIEKARLILRPLAGAERKAQIADDSEGDPQPEIDDEKLERMYRVLSPDA
jgi:hypothetical protein